MATDWEKKFEERVAEETGKIGVTRPVSDLLAQKFWAANDPNSMGTTMRAGGDLKDFKKQNDGVDGQIKDRDFAAMLDRQTKTNIHLAGAVADLYLDNPSGYHKRMTALTDRVNNDPAYATELKKRLESGEAFNSISELNGRINIHLAQVDVEKKKAAIPTEGVPEKATPAEVAVAATVAAVVVDPFRTRKAEESIAEWEKMKAADPELAKKFSGVDDTIKAALKQHPGKIEMLANKEEREKLEAELAKSKDAFKTAFAGPAAQGDFMEAMQSLRNIPVIGGLIEGIMGMFQKTPGGTGFAIGDLGQALMGAFAGMFGGSQVGQVMVQRGQEQMNGKKVDSPVAKLGASGMQGDTLSIADRATLARADVTVSVALPSGEPPREFNGYMGALSNLLPGPIATSKPAPAAAVQAPQATVPGALLEPTPTWGTTTAGTA